MSDMNKKRIYIFAVVVIVLAIVGTVIASSSPDGLETVAEQLGFSSAEKSAPISAPMPDYSIGGSTIGGVFAGVVGTAAAFGSVIFLLYIRQYFASKK